MKNIFKIYKNWRDKRFIDRINKVYFSQDENGNLYFKGVYYLSKEATFIINNGYTI